MSLRVRVLITAVVLLHLTAVVDVLTGDASTLSRGWTRTTMTAQSWDMFSKILEEAQVVTIPGAGFGPGGEGFLRLSAFAPRASCEEACQRLRTAMAPTPA